MAKRLGIIGHPVAHSLSPVFQGAALRECGLDVGYEAWDTPLEALEQRVASLREEGVLGANVTVPHKEVVIRFLDELGGQSSAVGAVNTIVNRWAAYGFNTDGPGFVRALRQRGRVRPGRPHPSSSWAPAAPPAASLSPCSKRASNMAIANRTRERAQSLARALDAPGRVSVVDAETSPAPYDCVINTTSVGMHGTGTEGRSPVEFPVARPGQLAVDIVYAPK
ncbi:MAG: shikimate dehydrogenase [Dehalococcoidia bacterium]|nr:shikimate dehydrogenase [Dehalococcoidia bacterium]